MVFIGGFLGLPHIRSGRLRALAIVDAARAPALPDLPTIAEAGFPAVDARAWFGLLAPTGTPDPIIRRVHAAATGALAEAALRERVGNMGMRLIASSPEDMVSAITAETARMAAVI